MNYSFGDLDFIIITLTYHQPYLRIIAYSTIVHFKLSLLKNTMLLNTFRCSARYIASARTNLIITRSSSIKVAIVGSGPAGFYTTQKLLKNPDIKVDIYEKLPVPFGLVRYGVAPDHADVKNVINSFTSVANNDRVDFYGNIDLGKNIVLDDLIDAYHVVVLCYGSAQDKLLNIEGEQTTKNTISARNFVGWYNGVPEDKDLKINLDCDTACIIGQGNVALDCARILLKPANLEKTDITSYAQELIAKSKIRRIYIVGRRGPFQVSFTIKELRELIKLNEGKTRLEPDDLLADGVDLRVLNKLSRPRRRMSELLINLSTVQKKDLSETGGIECIFKFLSKPVRIIGDQQTGNVSQLELQKTQFDTIDSLVDETAKPIELDEYETINCGLIIRSIGYKAVMVDKNLPIDHKQGSVLNTNGRIQGHRSLYCSGWLATGASGVIAGTLNSSQVTAQSILDDIAAKDLPNLTRKKLGYEKIKQILVANKIQVVHFNEWLRIDELERRLGEELGKTREKFVDVNKMLEVARVPEGEKIK